MIVQQSNWVGNLYLYYQIIEKLFTQLYKIFKL